MWKYLKSFLHSAVLFYVHKYGVSFWIFLYLQGTYATRYKMHFIYNHSSTYIYQMYTVLHDVCNLMS